MEAVRRLVEDSVYARGLGVKLEALDDGRIRLAVPYREENANPGGALHGGVAASTVAIAAQALAREGAGSERARAYCCALEVVYVAAAVGEAVVGEARLLRRGRGIAFVDAAVRSASGREIAHGLVTVRTGEDAGAGELPVAAGDDGASDPGPLGPHVEKTPFIGRLGMRIEHMAGGRSRIRLPASEALAGPDGGLHEGALLALLDTTGAMAAWAETGPGPYRASTPALQAQILAPPGRGELVGYGRVVRRDREIFLCRVEVARARDGRLAATGVVTYRIAGAEARA